MKDLNDFLRRLRVDRWSDDPHRDTTCHCPAHEDSTASMTVCLSRDNRQILVNCHKGCTVDAILASMGLTKKDLYIDNGSTSWGAKVHTTKNPSAGKTSSTAGAAGGPPSPKGEGQEKREKPKWHFPPEKVYHYTDENGEILFDVLRFKTDDGGKTFLRGIPDPRERHGWRMKNTTRNEDGSPRRNPLYRLPAVLQAMADGERIYLVEGEKDADNLAACGRCATTNAGGASTKGSKVKWTDEHTETLRGADVIIIPDVDETGMSDRRTVANRLLGVAGGVKLVDLRKGYAEMPPKGDISDLMDLVGKDKALEILDQLIADARPWGSEPEKPEKDPAAMTHYEYITSLYEDEKGYGMIDGCMARWNRDALVPMGNFLAAVKETKIRDNGEDTETELTIEGWTEYGRPLPDAHTTIGKLRSGEWVDEAWPMQATIRAGSTQKDHLRYLMQVVGQKVSRRVVEYTHTGWRKIGDQWCYLSHESCIGREDVTVALPDSLNGYSLRNPGYRKWEEISALDAMAADWEIERLLPEEIAVPLMGMTYLAPLQDALTRGKCRADFILYLCGRTQSGKSETAKLMEKHFGVFDEFPSNFNSSATVLKANAFVLKDCLNVIDDYKPSQSVQARNRMNDIFQNLVRGYSDGNFRQTANADGTPKKAIRARGVCMATGETLPMIDESGLARLFIVQMDRKDLELKDVEQSKQLTKLQNLADKGYFLRHMMGYIEWLTSQMDTLPDLLHDRFIRYRELAAQELHGSDAQARAPSAVAHLMLGYEMKMQYEASLTGQTDPWGETDVWEKEKDAPKEKRTKRYKAWRDLIDAAKDAASDTRETAPTEMFLSIVSESLASGKAAVYDLDDNMKITGRGDLIGYKDTRHYYLLTKPTQALLGQHMKAAVNGDFPVGMGALERMLREDGLLIPSEDGKRNTRIKKVDNKVYRCLWIPARYIDGFGEPEVKQEGMDFTKVDVDVPF